MQMPQADLAIAVNILAWNQLGCIGLGSCLRLRPQLETPAFEACSTTLVPHWARCCQSPFYEVCWATAQQLMMSSLLLEHHDHLQQMLQ